MTILPLIEVPDPFLREKSLPVTVIDDKIKKLAVDMAETMIADYGIGLAAPQVGHHLRMIVIQPTNRDLCQPPEEETNTSPPQVFINPEIIKHSETRKTYEEGCLSVPRVYAPIKRWDHVTLRWQTLDGETKEEEFTGLMAVIAQHEIDHLDGILFVDYLSKLKRDMLLKRMEKLRNEAI